MKEKVVGDAQVVSICLLILVVLFASMKMKTPDSEGPAEGKNVPTDTFTQIKPGS